MKKKVLLFSLLMVFLMFTLSFIIADTISIDNSSILDTEHSKIIKAETCLRDKIDEKGCDDLSYEEKIFSLLAVGECKSELQEDEKVEGCWPDSGCKVKTTAQAILALNGDEDAETWLLAQTKAPEDLSWYLEIENPNGLTKCTIIYDDKPYIVNIGEDKKIDSNAGTCLRLSEEGGYWLKVSPTCYEKEFSISCDQSFLTTLLFKKDESPTIHVSEKTSSASAEGTTTEKVNSECFAQGNTCDYEGSLWAVLVLDFLDYDRDAYMPYLITMADESENRKYIPESFLYYLTSSSDFLTDLLSRQVNQYWDVSGNKFYDTAIALYPFQNEEPAEKTKAKEWLLEVQDSDGCWQGNIKDTAFILYSIWESKGTVIPDDDNCELDGYYCVSSYECQEAKGSELNLGGCSGVDICCDNPKVLETCADLGGEICSSDKECDISTIDSYDSYKCCLGICQEPSPAASECSQHFGECKTFCGDDEEEGEYDCEDSSTFCCIEKLPSPSGNYWWIWVLLILIVVVVIGIVFKDKLNHYWFRLNSMFGGSKPDPRRPAPPEFGFPSSRPRPSPSRRIMPPSTRRPLERRPITRPSGELDDVLKKLKEMGS